MFQCGITVGNYACSRPSQKAGGIVRRPGAIEMRSQDGMDRPKMSRVSNDRGAVQSAITALKSGDTPDRTTLRDAVRELLRQLSARAPGRSVEVRVPPFGAVQCIPGPRHTRGTPPNVVEMDAVTWVKVATGEIDWLSAVDTGVIRVSGVRADLSPFLPLSPAS